MQRQERYEQKGQWESVGSRPATTTQEVAPFLFLLVHVLFLLLHFCSLLLILYLECEYPNYGTREAVILDRCMIT